MVKIVPLPPVLAHSDGAAALQAQFAHPLKAVDALIAQRLASPVATIPDIGAHVIRAGGKRLRPLLTLASAALCRPDAEPPIKLAAAVELLHTATLLHDDVVDASEMRRGLPSARARWGNAASVLVGDFLLGQAFKLMVESASPEALPVLANAAAVIAEGEVMQLLTAGKVDVNEDAYLRVINAKTAELFAAAARVGSLSAGAAPNAQEALAAYGRNLGIAFQLSDDALDYDRHARLGKNWGDDFREGKMTLPLILAYHRGDTKERRFWQAAVARPRKSKASLHQAESLVLRHRALADTLARAAHYAAIAQDALRLFPPSPGRTGLMRLAGFSAARRH